MKTGFCLLNPFCRGNLSTEGRIGVCVSLNRVSLCSLCRCGDRFVDQVGLELRSSACLWDCRSEQPCLAKAAGFQMQVKQGLGICSYKAAISLLDPANLCYKLGCIRVHCSCHYYSRFPSSSSTSCNSDFKNHDWGGEGWRVKGHISFAFSSAVIFDVATATCYFNISYCNPKVCWVFMLTALIQHCS